jgi:hypothetical protein
MNSNVIRSLALAAVLTGVACAPPPPPRERVVVYEQPAPPPPVTEVVVAQPGPEYVWVRGHHRWDEGAHAYVWVSGRWVVPPTGFHAWHEGHWQRGNHAYVWIEGRWS